MPVTSDEIIDTLKTMSAREACDDAGVTLEYLIKKGKKELEANKSDAADWATRQKARSLFHDIRADKPATKVDLEVPKGRITIIMNMSGEEPTSKSIPGKGGTPRPKTTKKGAKKMPKVTTKSGKVKHYPYTEKGKSAAKAYKKKMAKKK